MDTNTSLPRLRRLWRLAEERDGEVWWRHDVDYDITCAVQMAKLEQRCGVSSTYFFLSDENSYLLWKDDLQVIAGCGHKIAPHVDLHSDRHSDFTDAQLFDACQDAFDALCAVFQPVERTVSFHQPPRKVIGRDVPGFQSAQGPFWQRRQTADSRGVFRRPPEDLLAMGGPVQINLHPEWWFWPKAKQDEWRKLEASKP